MLKESFVICAVTVVLAVLLLREENKNYALGSLSLLAVPLANLLSVPAARLFSGTVAANHTYFIRCFVVLAGTAVACALSALCAGRFSPGKGRKLYLWISVGYSVLLGCIFLYHILAVL